MCDKESFDNMRDDIQEIREWNARVDERLKTLFARVTLQFWAMFFALILLLLTVIYMAIGNNGFHDVVSSAEKLSTIGKHAK